MKTDVEKMGFETEEGLMICELLNLCYKSGTI